MLSAVPAKRSVLCGFRFADNFSLTPWPCQELRFSCWGFVWFGGPLHTRLRGAFFRLRGCEIGVGLLHGADRALERLAAGLQTRQAP